MAKKDKHSLLSKIALKPVEISAELPEEDNKTKELGLKVARRYTKAGENVFDTVQWDKRTTTISDEKGNIISQITDVEVPTTWTQLATDILAYKYLRKAGVPTKEARLPSPEGLPSRAGNTGYGVANGGQGREVSLKQAVYRIAHTIADFGEKFGYFASPEDRVSYEDELTHILVNQKAAFNSPVWFNCGLYHQYKIAGSGGSFYWDFEQEKVLETKDSYRNPQCSACFILAVEDSLDAIFNLLKTESRIFKFGSGSGANFSKLRSKYERLSGGGTSSGMMSFLRVFDRGADAVKSGGTTRRAAKMVVVDMSHPEIEDFISWKVNEEKKVMALIAAGYSSDFNGEAYHTVSGQNSNNSVRITDEFMEAAANDGEWTTRYVSNGEPHKTYRAKELMDQIANAAWQCADPGVQFDTTINKWHTCPNTDRINASNPCCITGDTLIAVADGRNAVPIKDLVGTEVPVYSHSHRTGKTTVSRMWNIGVKRQNAPIYEVLLDDGTTFRATDDHLIMLRDGSYRMVRDLVAKDSLMPFHSKVLAPAKNRTKRRYFWSGQSWLPQYRAVWQYFNGKQPVGSHIHHQDFNARNDLLENLVLLSMEEHQAIHRDSMLGDNNPARRLMSDQWRANISKSQMGEKNGNFGHSHSDETRAKMREQSAVRWSNPEERLKSSFGATKWLAQAKAEGRRVGRVPGERFERCCPICRHNYLTARPEQIFCSVACKLSPKGIQMYGPKIWEANRGRQLSVSHRTKLSIALKLVSDPADKSRAGRTAHRNYILRAARLLLDNNITPALEDWDTLALQARQLGAKRVPSAGIVKQYFSSDKKFVEAASLNNHKVVSVSFAGYEDVYDGTVDKHHNFAILTSTTNSCVKDTSNYSGIFIHNSEYMFLDSTACNLASINLVKFADDKGNFDIEGYRHACKIMFIAQEIEVDLSSYPTDPIAKNSHDYRPLGLGFANLGTLLMLKGIPYDSPEALAIAGALSAIMTGHAYKTSAEMAAIKGAFEGFTKNRAPMLNVMKMHRQAAYAISTNYDHADLLTAAHQDWDEAVALGEQFGYRNSQATVIAPTGCLVGSSLVSTDRGLMRLQKLGQTSGDKWQDASFNVMTDDGPKRATKFFVNGQQPTRRIVTKSGYEIQGTLKHRIRVVESNTGTLVWKRFDELQTSDLIPLALNTVFGRTHFVPLPPLSEPYWASNESIIAPTSINPELAELVGYFMGDGSLHSKGLRFCVAGGDDDVTDRLVGIGRKLFNLEAKIATKKGYTEVVLQSVALAIWWDACGFSKHVPESKPAHRGKGYQPHIPDILLATNNRSVYQAFLRGLFEADGTASGGVPVFSSASHQFSQEIASLLLALGYPVTRKIDQSGWGKKELYVLRLRNASYNPTFKESIGFISQRKTRLLISLSADQTGKRDYIYLPREVFEELIPVGSPERGVALQSLNRYGALARGLATKVEQRVRDTRLKTALQYIYDPIVSNTDGGIAPTYDLSVPENVTYIANGFVSHNTIGLLMDCDTTGVEPDFALVKFKKLAGGGSMKIVNTAVKQALMNLGYTHQQQQAIIDYAVGTGTFVDTSPINRITLAAKGLTTDEIDKVEATLPSSFDITFSFNRMVLGSEIFARLAITETEEIQPSFSLLARLGFSQEEIDRSNTIICGTQTVEGAPELKDEHLSVFDCANRCGPTGKRFIAPLAHVRMMAAVQPFISGAISKTINMPNEATVADVEEVYLQSWHLGLKALALYRDGSKLSQPLNTKKDDVENKTEVVETVVEKIVYAPKRRRMPDERRSITHKFDISGHKGYITVGLFEDGSPGEIFVTMAKQGSVISGLMDAFATAISISLQFGVPLTTWVRKFVNSRFEPYGFTTNPQIRIAKSIIDYIARYLGIKFLTPEQQVELGIKADGDASSNQGHLDFNAVPAPTKLSEPTNGDMTATPEAVAPPVAPPMEEIETIPTRKQQQTDAPACPSCGSLTFKTGTCYTCLSCGSTTGGCS